MDDFVTMKEIGRLFGVSSHAVGKKLKERGYRTPNGKPSSQAFQAGMVQQKFTFDYANYLWAWNVTKTTALLEEAGMVKVPPCAAS